MNNIQTLRFDTGDGKIIELETGRLARQAHGSVVLKVGNTMLLATAVSNYEAREGIDFMPLTVDYQEKFAAVGRIPGSFHRREARPSDYEVLISRLIDRALRPLFPEDYHAETQVLVYLISADENSLPDQYAGFAASTAIMLSDIPFNGPISEVRVARINGEFVLNPYRDQLEQSDMDMIVSGTMHDINMVEGEMSEASEEDMLAAMKFAHEHIKIQCARQMELAEMIGGRKVREYTHEVNDADLRKEVLDTCTPRIREIAESGKSKAERKEAFKAVLDEYLTRFEGAEDADLKKSLAKKYFHEAEYYAMRQMILESGRRLDGRNSTQIRDISCITDYLPAAHGSSVFTRGETQALATVTLGGKLDEQLLDSPMLHGYSRFMLHYNFPPFSTGEARPMRGTGRREIGHGNLALRGLKKMVPDDFPYVVRIVSDVLESNGSSSMATVCSGSMAMMDAGMPLQKPVGGIAMGLITDENSGKYAILSDILGDEDHLGDMDFKVVGTRDGITACQMDIKIHGLKWEMVSNALHQAREGRLHILGEMSKAISQPREDYKSFVPRIEVVRIDKEFIGAVIGPGGKHIQELQRDTNTTISIEEKDGMGIVEIMSKDGEGMRRALERIRGIATMPVEGETYMGTVKTITDFGAFVEILPGKDGLLHISELAWERVPSMEGVFTEGDKLEVKLIEIDKKTGKYRLSRRALLPKPEGYVEREPRAPRPDGGNNRGGNRDRDRRDNRGPRPPRDNND
jgi:polyribonucleotide nucleotidyltransferase